MKKLLLFLFMMTTIVCGDYNFHTYTAYASRNIIAKSLAFVLNMAALSAKCTEYHFTQYHRGPVSLFRACNEDCVLLLRFNSTTRNYRVEFKSYNDSYDYKSFKKMIDFFLME